MSLCTRAMPDLLEDGLSDAESESGRFENVECSTSRCSSSTSVVSDAAKPETNLEGSTSLETGWTDSKHSSYLDFMEANFVQNMFARCYCMEDVCGGTADHHHLRQDQHCYQLDSHYKFEENDYNTAESQPLQQTLKCEIYDSGESTWTSAGNEEASAINTINLLENSWFKHFHQRNSFSLGIKTSDVMTKAHGQSQEATSRVIHNVHCSSGFKKPNKSAAVPLRIVHLKAADTRRSMSHAFSENSFNIVNFRHKRRTLWCTYKQLRKIQQKTNN